MYVSKLRRELGRLENALENDPRVTPARVRALNGLAVMNLGANPATTRRTAEEALVLSDRLSDSWGAAYAGFMLGHAAANLHDFPAAQQAFSESLRGFRALGDDHYTLLATDGLAGVFDELGDVASARPLHEENLLRARALGNRRVAALSLDQLASYARDGAGVLTWVAELNEETLGLLRSRLSERAIAEAFDRGQRLTVDEAVALALDA